jgi:hypothetical protein
MGECSALATKAELAALESRYIPKVEKAGILSSAASTASQLAAAAAAVPIAKAAQAYERSINAANIGQQAVNAARGAKADAVQAGKTAYEANRQALIAKGTAIDAAQKAATASATAATAQQAAATASAAQATAAARLAALAVFVASLAITVASFALVQGQLRATQARIDALEAAFDRYNADYTRLINMISQNRIAIQKNEAAIAAADVRIRNNEATIAVTNSRVSSVESTNRSLSQGLSEANQRINLLTSEVNAANAKSDSATKTANEALEKANLALSKIPVPPPPTDLSDVYAQINGLERQIELLKSDNNGLKVALNTALSKVEQKEDKYIVRRVEKATITNASDIRDLNGQVVGLPSKFGSQLDSVTKTITQKFTEADIKTSNDIITKTGLNKPQVEQIVDTKLKVVTKMNQEQSDQINSKLDVISDKTSKFPTPTQIAIAVGALDILRQINSKPSGGTACLAPALVPPVGAQAKVNGAAIAGLQSVTVAQNVALQKGVTAVNTTVGTVAKEVTGVTKLLQNTQYGLQAIQRAANVAWKATQADKVLSLVNTALNIHNAVMLSNNIGRSMAYIANNTLQAFGVTDSTTGLPIDVGSIVKNKLNSMINSMLGVTQADALRRQLAGYNRIYQAGANVLWSVRSIMDSAYDIAETTGENVSQIGNALKKAGAVRENAYRLMPTDFRSTSRVQRRLEKIGNVADTIEQISGDAVSLTEEVKEMKSNQKEFQDELKKATDAQTKIEDAKKREVLNTPEHKAEDEIRAIPEEKTK